MMVEIRELSLSNENISSIIDDIDEAMEAVRKKDRNSVRAALIMEEVLLKYRDRFGEDTTCFFSINRRLNRTVIKLSFSLPSYDPFSDDDPEASSVLNSLLSGQGITPQWNYLDGKNVISYSVRKKIVQSTALNLVISIALAIILGLLNSSLPENISGFLADQIATPLYETFMGLISFISSPLIFLSVLWGIYSIGDTASLSRVGKKMMSGFLINITLISAVGYIVALRFYEISAEGGANFAFQNLYEMVLDIVPDNLIAPFLNGNSLQIIFIAVITGLAMLILSEKTTVAAKFVEQTNYIVQLIMETISSLIPIFVFLSIFQLVSTGGLELFTNAYKLFISLILGGAVMLVSFTAYTCATRRINPVLLIKKILPAAVVALTTGSSAAAFALDVENSEKLLGIDRRLVNIGVPLGQTVFKPGAALLFFTIGMYISEYYGVNMNVGWAITLFILTLILALAAPPIPGGGLTCFTMLVMQLGIPGDAIALCCALDVIPEFIITSLNIAMIQIEMVVLASSLNMVDYKTLRK